jgi:hypothetical protein
MARQLAIGRIVIGVLAMIAPALAARLFGFPSEHDNGTARVMGRLFGVRDIVLGGLVLQFADDPAVSRHLHRGLACVDAGDATSALVALARRDGIDRAALGLFVIAGAATATGIQIARAEDERALRHSDGA